MKHILLKIEGMTCSGCAAGLEKYLNKQEKIESAEVNLVLAQASISYDDSLTIKDLNRYVEEAGFHSLGEYHPEEEKDEKVSYKPVLFYGILALLVLYISMGHMVGLPEIPFLSPMTSPKNYALVLFLFTLPFFYYGRDILISGIKNLIHRTYNMDTLVSLGVFASFFYSFFSMMMIFLGDFSYTSSLYFESCIMILYFIQLGRRISENNFLKTKEALRELVQITPNEAYLKKDGGIQKVTIDEVHKNDILVVQPGMRVAVDGKIVWGSAHFDDAFITGESTPVKKKKGDAVVAGSINLDGVVHYQAERIGKNSTISEIVQYVVEAGNKKAPIQRIADVVCSYFVPVLFFLAVLTLIGSLLCGLSFLSSFVSFVNVLVVACPCALGLATPLALFASEGNLTKRGVLVKSGEIIENIPKIDTVVFDKTGTLTYGNLRISKVYNYSKRKDDEILAEIASVQQNSTHPIAKAFLQYVQTKHLMLSSTSNFQNLAGIGVQAKIRGKEVFIGSGKLFRKLKIENTHLGDEDVLTKEGSSIVYLIEEGKVLALVGVQDVVRTDAKKIISSLKRQGKDVWMVTGDHENTAQRVARTLGISNVLANVSPKDKGKFIEDLENQGKKVMMVGDGINDAYSLALATIGVSFHSGTDIAADSSDVLLMDDQISKLLELFQLGKKTMRIVYQNLFFAFFYNVCMIPLAMGVFRNFGIVFNPMASSLAMTLSSLTVVLNSLRLLEKKSK